MTAASALANETNQPYGRGEHAWFQHDRFGMFIHWGVYACAARHEWMKTMEKMPDEEYQRYLDHFDPDLFDPRQWARQARAAGMRYAVITTKHHDGFCLWDSAHTDYKAPNTPAGRDLLREWVDAFRAEGLRIGFYYSLLDWHHPDFTIDKHHPQRDDTDARADQDHKDMARYRQYMRDQVRELLSDYGPVDLMWFDFSYPGEDGKGHEDWGSEELIRLVRELQPQVLVDNRLDLPYSGDFTTPEQIQPERAPTDADGQPVVWEACQTFSGSWGYHRDENDWKTTDMLLRMLIDGVSKGGNLLLNVGPTGRGLIDARASERLAGMGEWMDLHERSIRGCGAAPAAFRPPADTRYTWNPATRRLYCHLFSYPYRAIVLPGLEGKVRYAQFLNDASELPLTSRYWAITAHLGDGVASGDLVLELPTLAPSMDIPVIELFLEDGNGSEP